MREVILFLPLLLLAAAGVGGVEFYPSSNDLEDSAMGTYKHAGFEDSSLEDAPKVGEEEEEFSDNALYEDAAGNLGRATRQSDFAGAAEGLGRLREWEAALKAALKAARERPPSPPRFPRPPTPPRPPSPEGPRAPPNSPARRGR